MLGRGILTLLYVGLTPFLLPIYSSTSPFHFSDPFPFFIVVAVYQCYVGLDLSIGLSCVRDRSPAAVSASSTAALLSGVLLRRSGVLAMAALRLTPALSSLVLCSRVVGSDGIGCRVLITLSEFYAP